MKVPTTFLLLVLASTNASNFLWPNYQFQQNPAYTKDKNQEIMAAAFYDDRFFPQVSAMDELTQWESPPDQTILLSNDLDTLENVLQDDPNDFRMKRTRTSLSIDNPLDVLRQQYYRALARRMKYKSIEKNREHLLKTGKRSPRDDQFQPRLNKQLQFPRKMSKKDFLQDGIGESDPLTVNSNEQNPTTRRYESRLDDLSFQT